MIVVALLHSVVAVHEFAHAAFISRHLRPSLHLSSIYSLSNIIAVTIYNQTLVSTTIFDLLGLYTI